MRNNNHCFLVLGTLEICSLSLILEPLTMIINHPFKTTCPSKNKAGPRCDVPCEVRLLQHRATGHNVQYPDRRKMPHLWSVFYVGARVELRRICMDHCWFCRWLVVTGWLVLPLPICFCELVRGQKKKKKRKKSALSGQFFFRIGLTGGRDAIRSQRSRT